MTAELHTFLKKLPGRQLRSISGRADIRIVDVDLQDERIVLENASGEKRTRPLDELVGLWQELQRFPAVHVDSFLGGSSSSRNQPETIIAAHPNVFWLQIEGRKHLALQRDCEHDLGELEELDAIAATGVRDSLRAADDVAGVGAIVVHVAPGSFIQELESLGCEVTAVGQGVTAVAFGNATWWIAIEGSLPGLGEGTYASVSAAQSPEDSTEVGQVGAVSLSLVDRGGPPWIVLTT